MKKEGEIRIPAGCAVAGIISKSGGKINGGEIVKILSVMRDRSNGLGGGFAGYGIYPEYKDYYALHVFYDSRDAKYVFEKLLEESFDIINLSKIPTKKIPEITNEPLIWRYFVYPLPTRLADSQSDEREFVARFVLKTNSEVAGAQIFSSGKNMGVFKAVGYPEDVGRFYLLDEYEGYCFTGHGRYPTNSPGWWGGAHPFALLDYTTVHNGEISSYDTNRQSMEMQGYKCTLKTDTEVITYMVDYLNRKVGLDMSEIAGIFAAPFWKTIEAMPKDRRKVATYLRQTFPSELITGPFSIIVGFTGGVMALNDRLKLRSMIVAEKGDRVYISSEEAAVRMVEPALDSVYSPIGGEAVVIRVNNADAL
jgi:glutamate synthase domain-containing protein 1